MSATKNNRRRCDGCGKISSNRSGEYVRQNSEAGYINSQEGDAAGKDFCDDCRSKGIQFPALPDKETLASEFIIVIREWLTPEHCREIDRLNAESRAAGDHSVCHSHDFCDANQAMIDALARFNVGFDSQDDAQDKLINDAWAAAQESGFGAVEE